VFLERPMSLTLIVVVLAVLVLPRAAKYWSNRRAV
jgi:putative tricarboxylic transport membrane protein